MMKTLLALAMLAIASAASAAGEPLAIDLWPSGAPTDNGDPRDTARVYVYTADPKKATGRAIVICPGGGYDHLALQHEGNDWAPYLNSLGITVAVLKYRMPHGNRKVPQEDAEEAIRLMKRNANQWRVDPTQVGIMGFSAGGHLASLVATRSKGDAAPAFQVLFYPVITMDPGFAHQGSHDNLLGKEPRKKHEREYSTDQQITRATPRAFIALSDDDHTVLPANGANYYLECYRHDVPASLHIYPTGGHGWGMRQSFPYHIEMLLTLKAWLQSF